MAWAKPSTTGSRAPPRRGGDLQFRLRTGCARVLRQPKPPSFEMNEAVKPVPAPSPDLIPRFAAIVGDKYAIRDPEKQVPYLVEMRDMFRGHTPVVLRPGSVAEVSEILKLANETGTPIVPQGGNTGLVGGQIPH